MESEGDIARCVSALQGTPRFSPEFPFTLPSSPGNMWTRGPSSLLTWGAARRPGLERARFGLIAVLER